MKSIMRLLLLLCSKPLLAQQPVILHIINDETHQPITGVTIHITPADKYITTDSLGNAFLPSLPRGKYTLQCTAAGCREKVIPFTLPTAVHTLTITLDPDIQTMQDVVISSTRTNRLLKNSPITVQVIDSEDIDEGTGQSPANIHELLTELSGMQVQTTSPVSGNAAIRLQGLDGRYTQLLKDGFPLYGGFSGSLSILQTPPLDLHQVEVIKGAGSALYGGDAIAGIINLISRTPDTTLHLNAILNQTNRGGTDLGTFVSQRGKHAGFTIMGSGNRQTATDVNNDGFTDLPRIRQGTLAPTFFWYLNDSTTLRLGVNVFTEDRTGGDLQAVRHGADNRHPFLQQNHTDRDYYQLTLTHKASHGHTFSLKNSIGYFYRSINQTTGSADNTPTLTQTGFSGAEISSYTEASYGIAAGTHELITGANLITDHFEPAIPHKDLAYAHNTIGIFAQDDWNLSRQLTLEAGARADIERVAYFLPRLALLYKPIQHFSIRWGGGLAYKLPTLFNATDEEDAYQQVYPIAPTVRTERSASTNLAIAYQGRIGDDLYFNADENIYYTRLNHALIPQTDSLQHSWLYYINAPGLINSYGSETNIRFVLDDLTLQLSYTYTQTRRAYLAGRPQLPLTPRSRLSTSLVYEAEPRWKVGVEGFYTGAQTLDNNKATRDFWTFDLMVQRSLGPWAVLLNLENFTDTRQSRFGPLYTSSHQNPTFSEIYAPLEGRIVSMALRYTL